jgi:putative salt-induced outer membrane protein
MLNSKTAPYLAALTFFLLATPVAVAKTPLPAGVEAMIRQAALRDGKALDTAESLALDAFPDHADAINALTKSLRDDYKKVDRAAKRAAAASVTAGWSGDAELGASMSSGNSSNKAVTMRVELVKETVKWRHEIDGGADWQRADGATSKERYTAGYKPNYFINPKLYAAGQLLWERDIFAGYRHRFTETAGVGYLILDGDGQRLSVEGGPGARQSLLVDTPGEPNSETEILFSTNVNYTQELGAKTKFSQAVKSLLGDKNQTLESTSSLTTQINSLFSARVAFTLRHETEPPDDRQQTDTLSRATLVYTF